MLFFRQYIKLSCQILIYCTFLYAFLYAFMHLSNIWGLLILCLLVAINFRFARMVNEKFRMTIFIQFVVSTLVMCFNLYQFTKSTALRAKYVQLILYMCSMLSQIFFYCWCGNEVKLKVCAFKMAIFLA